MPSSARSGKAPPRVTTITGNSLRLSSITAGSSVSSGSSGLALSTCSRTSSRAWSASNPGIELEQQVGPALVGGGGELLEALDGSELELHRTGEKALGVLRPDPLVAQVDVDDGDGDVGVGLLRDLDVGGEPGDEDEDEGREGGPRAADRRVDEGHEVLRGAAARGGSGVVLSAGSSPGGIGRGGHLEAGPTVGPGMVLARLAARCVRVDGSHLLAGDHELLSDGDDPDLPGEISEPDPVRGVLDDVDRPEVHPVPLVHRLEPDGAVVGEAEERGGDEVRHSGVHFDGDVGGDALADPVTGVRGLDLDAVRARRGVRRRCDVAQGAPDLLSSEAPRDRGQAGAKPGEGALGHASDEEDGVEIDDAPEAVTLLEVVPELRVAFEQQAVERSPQPGPGDLRPRPAPPRPWPRRCRPSRSRALPWS